MILPPSGKQRLMTPPEIGALLITTLFFLGMLAVALFEEYSIYKFSVPIFAVSWALLLVIHEFGHALMAKAVNWKIEKVSIGIGKLIAKKKIFGMQTEFHTIPISGFVSSRPTDLVQPQLKNFLIYAAGPGIELLLVGLFWLVLGTETFFSRQPMLWLIALQSFSVAAVFGAVTNLIPLPHLTEKGMVASDGLGMILAWKITDKQYAEMMRDTEEG